jgi:cytochrome c-type protein NapB
MVLGGAVQAAPMLLPDDAIGLSKTSVFDDPAPPEFAYPSTDPKQSGVLSRYWEDAPPQIPHRLDKYLPVTLKLNKCLDCHDDPDEIGKKVKGKPTPMSETHYAKKGGDLVVENKRYVCNLCHVPQAEVGTLVDNTFKGD